MSTVMIAGLGNPGPKYQFTRHNAGFLVLDFMAEQLGFRYTQKKWKAEIGTARSSAPAIDLPGDHPVREIVFIKPQGYMNLSGESVAPAMKHYEIQPAGLFVIHDEIDLPYAELRIKNGGGHRGHNGLRDIIKYIGNDFDRLRFGVGRPENEAYSVADYVLSNFAADEKDQLIDHLQRGMDIVLNWIRDYKGSE